MNLGLGTYLNPLEKSYAYKNVICDLLFNLLKETTNHVKQDELKIKLTNDFPYLDYPNKNTDIFYTLLMNLSTGSGKLKLFNTNFLNFYFSNVKSLNGRQEFNYRGSNFYAFQNITHEDLSFTNGKLSGVNSAFNQNGLDLVLKLHSNEKEIQYFQNNKLVLKKVILYDDKEYSYEFDNGVNLTLQILDDEIKSGIAYLKNKDYESAIRVFEKALANNFPEYLSQNVLLKKQLSLAQVQYSNYLTKQEAARLAEEKRQEAARLAEEKKQEAARIAEAQRKEAARLASACSRCGGTGTSSYGKTTHKTYCRYCGGNGIRGWDQCKYCDGRGWNWAKCMYCAGTGQEP
jgi:tetratricopeptide (TPR) repeat protein